MSRMLLSSTEVFVLIPKHFSNFLYYILATMGRKRTTEQKRKFAEGNGYNDDGEMVDNNPVPRNILPYTREKYSVQGLLWTE